MLVLKPILHETIWGGERICRLANIEGHSVGHLYSLFCREGISNEILNGEFAGKTMNDVFPFFKNDCGMGEYEYFPLTLALTEADENLSIQVHPTDNVANEIEHKSRGKRESWYFIEAPTDGYIINGCNCRNLNELDQMLEEKKYLEIVDKLYIKKGDYVFVEPGTLHSITRGSLVYEIEEGADYTYRFYDYDRIDLNGEKRELHIDKARTTLNIAAKSEIKHYSHGNEIIEQTYVTQKLEKQQKYSNHTGELVCFTLVAGNAICDHVAVTPGMTVILWPGDEIYNADIELAFVARMRG